MHGETRTFSQQPIADEIKRIRSSGTADKKFIECSPEGS